MLITGGKILKTGTYERTDLSSVEIFDPRNPSLTCSLPDMTVSRNYHASVGITVCGDCFDCDDGHKTCEKLDGRRWTVSHQLQKKLSCHGMWQSPSKVIIND